MNEIKIFKALGNPIHLKILETIKYKKKCICKIIPLVDKSQPNVSYHIKILKNAGLITEHRNKTNTYIEASNKDIFEIIKTATRL